MKKMVFFTHTIFVLGVTVLFLMSCAPSSRSKALKDAELHYKIGVSYLNENELQKAFVEFQETIRLNPKDKQAYNGLGYISAKFKEYDKAIVYYKRAIFIDPNYSEAMNNLGLTYLELENWDEAVTYFRMALQNPLYPTPEKAHSGLGYALYKKGDYAEALRVLREGSAKYSESYFSMHVLGLVYTELNRIEDAVEMYRKALEIAPYYTEARWELAHAYMRIGENMKAYDQFQLIAQAEGDNKRGSEARRYMHMLIEP